MISFTIDLEDPSEQYAPDGRYITMTRHILDVCDNFNRRATFFIVGRVAESAPQLVQDIALKGHEIAYHTHAHVPLTLEDPKRFECETRQDKDHIEQLTGKKVVGFRAPQFSLTPQSIWSLDILGNLGFTYSSSVMPTRLSRHGFAGLPRSAFVWANGLFELPLPTTATLGLPYLGGIYLYALPFCVSQRFAHRALPSEILWTYTHPYDFDHDNKFARMPHTPCWVSTLLGMARFVADKKIERILQNFSAPPLAERLKDINPLLRYPFAPKE